mmetsp:Transcript_15969/g.26184  ORF Transcript_15969/g.26184 Transcript_15969/m.26184 type:complete len:204 (+) Transcript_15969:100-711(+)
MILLPLFIGLIVHKLLTIRQRQPFLVGSSCFHCRHIHLCQNFLIRWLNCPRNTTWFRPRRIRRWHWRKLRKLLLFPLTHFLLDLPTFLQLCHIHTSTTRLSCPHFFNGGMILQIVPSCNHDTSHQSFFIVTFTLDELSAGIRHSFAWGEFFPTFECGSSTDEFFVEIGRTRPHPWSWHFMLSVFLVAYNKNKCVAVDFVIPKI